MKIACDVHISNRTIKKLKELGFETVYKAKDSEPDKSWFDKSMMKGAKVFISNDSDIARLVQKNWNAGVFWVMMPDMRHEKATEYLAERLQFIKIRWFDV